jgi:hypothetical protein
MIERQYGPLSIFSKPQWQFVGFVHRAGAGKLAD